jgi:hypothetical protein
MLKQAPGIPDNDTMPRQTDLHAEPRALSAIAACAVILGAAALVGAFVLALRSLGL